MPMCIKIGPELHRLKGYDHILMCIKIGPEFHFVKG